MTEKLSKLHHDGLITDAEYDRLKKALNSLRVDEMYQLEMEQADQFIPLSVVQDIKIEFSPAYAYGATEIWKIIDEHIEEYTE